jgi:hypothetical protein
MHDSHAIYFVAVMESTYNSLGTARISCLNAKNKEVSTTMYCMNTGTKAARKRNVVINASSLRSMDKGTN